MIICSITLLVVLIVFYKLNRVGYKIDLLWLNESQVSKRMNEKILEELNKK